MLKLRDGQDCDPNYTWHVDPQDAQFVDDWVDICDAWPPTVEANKDYYLTNEDYCPRGMTVIAVTRQ